MNCTERHHQKYLACYKVRCPAAICLVREREDVLLPHNQLDSTTTCSLATPEKHWSPDVDI